MLEQGYCAPDPRKGPRSRAPFLVHGRTFLENREILGRSLFEARADYRDWAISRAEAGIESELSDALEIASGGEALTAEAIDALRRTLAAKASDPGRGRPHVSLVEWLGDVSASEVTAGLERELANELLAAVGERARHEERADLVERSWSKVGDWFAPAFDARIVALLVPSFDAERNRVGFYRFVLPRPRAEDAQPLPIPSKPLALRTVRWLLSDPTTAGLIVGRLRVIDVAYGRSGRRELRRAGCATGDRDEKMARVELSLAGEADDETAAPLRLTAYFPEDSDLRGVTEETPYCAGVQADPDGPAQLRILERKLNRAIGLAQPPTSAGAASVSAAGAAGSGAGTTSTLVISP
jgi:hypothetical protein